MNLDVGCGDHPRGNVNIDVVTGWNPQTGDHEKNIKFVNPKKIPNFIKASGEYLPFRDEIFEVVFAYDVIEHTDNPFQMLKEMARVSNSKVILKVPHRYSSMAKMKAHKSSFGVAWFLKAANKLGYESRIHPTYEDVFQKSIFDFPLKRIAHMFVIMKKYARARMDEELLEMHGIKPKEQTTMELRRQLESRERENESLKAKLNSVPKEMEKFKEEMEKIREDWEIMKPLIDLAKANKTAFFVPKKYVKGAVTPEVPGAIEKIRASKKFGKEKAEGARKKFRQL